MSATQSYGKFRYYSPYEQKAPPEEPVEIAEEAPPYDFYAKLKELEALHRNVPRNGGKKERDRYFDLYNEIDTATGTTPAEMERYSGLNRNQIAAYRYGYHVPRDTAWVKLRAGLIKAWEDKHGE